MYRLRYSILHMSTVSINSISQSCLLFVPILYHYTNNSINSIVGVGKEGRTK